MYSYDIKHYVCVDVVIHHRLFCLIALCPIALGLLCTLQIFSEGFQRMPIMHAESWSHYRTLHFVPKSSAGLFCVVNPHYCRGGEKRIILCIHLHSARTDAHVHTLKLNICKKEEEA